MEQDRLARETAERQLDAATRLYQSAIASQSPAEIETLRRQVEDQQLALRSIQERERMNEQTLAGEIQALRTQLESSRQQGQIDAQALAERQAEIARREADLERLRRERAEDALQRAELDRQHQMAIAEATQKRQEAEAQAQELRQQVVHAQQEAQQAMISAEQSKSQIEELKQQQQQTHAELHHARQEAERLRLQNELSRLASTRSDQRGLIVTLPGIFFDTGKSQLKPGAKNTLSKIAAQLKTSPNVTIAVEGHTDSIGSEETNAKLSTARANAVREYLASVGIPDARVTATGRGEGSPVATNETAAGRQQNRRVELVITTDSSQVAQQ
jgi:outer membrane protein OmpA-like peptidoglycan-associated protein